MASLFQKLNLQDQEEILILNEPQEFSQEISNLKHTNVVESLLQVTKVEFAVFFIQNQEQLRDRIETLFPKLIGDFVLWFAYPKDTSIDWSVLGDYNLEAVQKTEINSHWNASRFRNVRFVRNLNHQPINGAKIFMDTNKHTQVIPVLRFFDLNKMREFYIDWLGFQIDWEHQLGEDAPLYIQLSKGSIVLHLTEHFSDCNPGAFVFIHYPKTENFHQELMNKNYKYSKPLLEKAPWNAWMFQVTDPFGNKITFNRDL